MATNDSLYKETQKDAPAFPTGLETLLDKNNILVCVGYSATDSLNLNATETVPSDVLDKYYHAAGQPKVYIYTAYSNGNVMLRWTAYKANGKQEQLENSSEKMVEWASEILSRKVFRSGASRAVNTTEDSQNTKHTEWLKKVWSNSSGLPFPTQSQASVASKKAEVGSTASRSGRKRKLEVDSDDDDDYDLTELTLAPSGVKQDKEQREAAAARRWGDFERGKYQQRYTEPTELQMIRKCYRMVTNTTAPPSDVLLAAYRSSHEENMGNVKQTLPWMEWQAAQRGAEYTISVERLARRDLTDDRGAGSNHMPQTLLEAARIVTKYKHIKMFSEEYRNHPVLQAANKMMRESR